MEKPFLIQQLKLGVCDSPLTDEGESQAIHTGQALKNVKYHASYCGDLGRHRKTAKIILSQNLHDKPNLTEHIGFQEWNFGGYEGRTNEEMWTHLQIK